MLKALLFASTWIPRTRRLDSIGERERDQKAYSLGSVTLSGERGHYCTFSASRVHHLVLVAAPIIVAWCLIISLTASIARRKVPRNLGGSVFFLWQLSPRFESAIVETRLVRIGLHHYKTMSTRVLHCGSSCAALDGVTALCPAWTSAWNLGQPPANLLIRQGVWGPNLLGDGFEALILRAWYSVAGMSIWSLLCL